MELPDLVLLEVFSLLNLQERYGTLRLVCQRWKQLAEHQLKSQGSAIVYSQYCPWGHLRWPSDNRMLSSLEMIEQTLFYSYLANCKHKWIKKLYLFWVSGISLKSAGLLVTLSDSLPQLEELSIDLTYRDLCFGYDVFNSSELNKKSISQQALTFPNLRVLSAKQRFGYNVSITAPRLEKLIFWQFGASAYGDDGMFLVLSHPERLRYLQCKIVSAETRRFANLEQICAREVRWGFSLADYPQLRRLDLCLESLFEFESPCVRLQFLDTIESLLEEKQQLNLERLEITNFGVPNLIPENGDNSEFFYSLGRFYFRETGIKRFIQRFQQKKPSNFAVDRLPWFVCMCYTVGLQGYEQLASCCSKLNVQGVIVAEKDETRPTDLALVIRFLIDIGGVSYLDVPSSLGQEFFDRLKTVPYINRLIINNLPGQSLKEFDFICDIKFLSAITVYGRKIAIKSFEKNIKKSKIKVFAISSKLFKFHTKYSSEKTKFLINFKKYKWWPIEFDCLDEAFAYLKEKGKVETGHVAAI